METERGFPRAGARARSGLGSPARGSPAGLLRSRLPRSFWIEARCHLSDSAEVLMKRSCLPQTDAWFFLKTCKPKLGNLPLRMSTKKRF